MLIQFGGIFNWIIKKNTKKYNNIETLCQTRNMTFYRNIVTLSIISSLITMSIFRWEWLKSIVWIRSIECMYIFKQKLLFTQVFLALCANKLQTLFSDLNLECHWRLISTLQEYQQHFWTVNISIFFHIYV